MVASAKRKAERKKAFAEARAKYLERHPEMATETSISTSNQQISTQATLEPPNDTTNHNAEADTNNHVPENTTATKPARVPEPAHRYILFIGNLPFNVTIPQLESHFASVRPVSIRLSTDKVTGKPRGFAFLEFDDYSRLTTCLKNFHHSVFPAPGRSAVEGEEDQQKPAGKKSRPRRINVELTVGGGGRKPKRKLKIQFKNARLRQERQERKEKQEQQKRDAASKQKDANPTASKDEEDHIHPSRRAKVEM